MKSTNYNISVVKIDKVKLINHIDMIQKQN